MAECRTPGWAPHLAPLLLLLWTPPHHVLLPPQDERAWERFARHPDAEAQNSRPKVTVASMPWESWCF